MAKEFDITNHKDESDNFSEEKITKMLTEPSWLDVPLVDIKKLKDTAEEERLAIEEKHRFYENTYKDKQDLKFIAKDPAGYVQSKLDLYSADEKEDLKYLKNLADKKSVDPTTQPYRTDTVKKFEKLKEKLDNPRPSFNPTDPTNWGKTVHQVLDDQAKYEAELKELGLPKDFKKINRSTTNVSKLFKTNTRKSNWDLIRDTAKDPEDRKQIRQILFKDFNRTNGKGMKEADLKYIGKWVDPAAKKEKDIPWLPINYSNRNIETKPSTVEDIKKEINKRAAQSKRKTNGGLDDIIDDAMFSLKNPWIYGGSDE